MIIFLNFLYWRVKMSKYLQSGLGLLILLAVSCEGNHPPVADFTVTEGLDEITLDNISTDEDGDPLSVLWNVNLTQVLLSDKTLSQAYFVIPELENPVDVTVELTVTDNKDDDRIKKTFTLPVLNESRFFGLGMETTKKVSNDVKNEWYIDQGNTGQYSLVNCGPTSVTMAIKWADSLYYGNPQSARSMYHPEGGWWYTNNIISFLNYRQVNNYVIPLGDMSSLTSELDRGNIAILCLDMFFISDEVKGRWHVDKFYATANAGWGHFIVVKGYRIADGKLLFEAYDPYGFGKTYTDGAPKGKNRYYRSEDIDDSTGRWWDFAIIVSREPGKGEGALDPSTIPHKYGGQN